MDLQGKKKEWVTPELSVLVRSHPEEAVLAACKGLGGTSGADAAAGGCGVTGTCGLCVDFQVS
jgi:hypothetical protein